MNKLAIGLLIVLPAIGQTLPFINCDTYSLSADTTNNGNRAAILCNAHAKTLASADLNNQNICIIQLLNKPRAPSHVWAVYHGKPTLFQKWPNYINPLPYLSKLAPAVCVGQ